MPSPVLHIGNKNYSSWSLRPWLALTWAGIPFEERVIPLGGPGYGKSRITGVLAVSPSGRVPVLHLGEHVIHDSLAICEWAAEQSPALWPADAMSRALARAVSAEMHSGFSALRQHLPMNIRRRTPARDWNEDTLADIARVQELWTSTRARFSDQGPWLFGARTIADAMFAPVCTRFRTYSVALAPACRSYCDTLFSDPAFRTWEAAAQDEPMRVEQTDSV